MGRSPKNGIARKKRSYRLVDADHELLISASECQALSIPDLLHLWCDQIRSGDQSGAADLVGALHQSLLPRG